MLTRSKSFTALAVMLSAIAGCAAAGNGGAGGSSGDTPSTGGHGGTGGHAGDSSNGGGGGPPIGGTGAIASGGSGGASGSGGSGPAGSGGSASGDDAAPADDASSATDAATPADSGSTPSTGGPGVPAGGSTTPPPVGAYGGVGETPSVPLTYTTTPTPPLVASECPDDPTVGFTEYVGQFKVQRPSNLAAADRFDYKDGIYTFRVNSNDASHEAGNGTAPRTEARYTDFASGTHIWSADVMYEHVDKTCIMQIHNEVGNYATYLRITGDMMFDLKTRKTVIEGYVNKWFNMKVYFDTQSLDVKIYINNCLKFSAKSPQGPTPNWYFKHGVYTCDSGTCTSHYKNIHLYEKGDDGKPIVGGMGMN